MRLREPYFLRCFCFCLVFFHNSFVLLLNIKKEDHKEKAWIRVSKTMPRASEQCLAEGAASATGHPPPGWTRPTVTTQWPCRARGSLFFLLSTTVPQSMSSLFKQPHCCCRGTLGVRSGVGRAGKSQKNRGHGESRAQRRFQAGHIWGTVL